VPLVCRRPPAADPTGSVSTSPAVATDGRSDPLSPPGASPETPGGDHEAAGRCSRGVVWLPLTLNKPLAAGDAADRRVGEPSPPVDGGRPHPASGSMDSLLEGGGFDPSVRPCQDNRVARLYHCFSLSLPMSS
jgi:hypothetical protein